MRVCTRLTRARAHSHPGYFGKVGMRHFHYTANKYHCPSLNVERSWHVVGKETLAAAQKAPKGKAPLIDVTQRVRPPPRALFVCYLRARGFCVCICMCIRMCLCARAFG